MSSDVATRAVEFDQFVIPNRPNLIAYAISLTRNRADAEDLVQDTLLKAFAAWERFRLASSDSMAGPLVRGWLYLICHNHFVSGWRRRSLRLRTPTADVVEATYATEDGHDPRQDMGRHQMGDEVSQALREIHPDHREIVLRHAEGQAYRQMAAELGISIGTVMSRLFRGRRALEELLGGYAKREYGIAPLNRAQKKLLLRVETAQSPQTEPDSIDTVVVGDDDEEFLGSEDSLDSVAAW